MKESQTSRARKDREFWTGWCWTFDFSITILQCTATIEFTIPLVDVKIGMWCVILGLEQSLSPPYVLVPNISWKPSFRFLFSIVYRGHSNSLLLRHSKAWTVPSSSRTEAIRSRFCRRRSAIWTSSSGFRNDTNIFSRFCSHRPTSWISSSSAWADAIRSWFF